MKKEPAGLTRGCVILLSHSALTLVCVALINPEAQAKPRPPLPPWPERTLSIWGFDEAHAPGPFESPGLAVESAVAVESWSGYALNRDTLAAAPVAVPVLDAATGRTNVAPDRGTIRFWFAPAWSSASLGGKGPGTYARLLELVALNGNQPETLWSLYVTPEGTELYFSGQGLGGATDYLKAPVAWEAGQWHLLALSYSPTNSALFLNGQPAAAGVGLPPMAPWKLSSAGLIVGSDVAANDPAQGQFDELTAFDYLCDAQQLGFYYRGLRRTVALGPLGSAAEELAKEQLLDLESQWFSAEFGPPSPGEPGEPEAGGENDPPLAYNYPSNSLWLELIGLTNQAAQLVLHGTIQDELYEILSKQALTDAVWVSEGTMVGAAGQDRTPATVPMLDRTNSLFVRARSLTLDSDGGGLPDWWQLLYFGQLGVPPYADPDNDGWLNLEEFYNGTNPTQFNTPPAPGGLTVVYGGAGSNVSIRWNKALGPVVGYTLERAWSAEFQEFNLAASEESFEDTLPPEDIAAIALGGGPHYFIYARYAAGNSYTNGPVAVVSRRTTLHAVMMRGPQGRTHLAVSGIPDNVGAVRLTAFDWFSGDSTNYTVSVESFSNGVFELPESWTPRLEYGHAHLWQVQALPTNGLAGAATRYLGARPPPFFDGREQLRENLAFLLRAGNGGFPFEFTRRYPSGSRFYACPANYASASFYELWEGFEGEPAASLWEFQPFDENYLYRNFVFSPSSVDTNGILNTGVYNFGDDIFLGYPPTYVFEPPAGQSAISPVLSASVSQWTYFYPYPSDYGLSLIGITRTTNYTLANNYSNLFGLRYVSAKLAYAAYGGAQFATLNAGGSVSQLQRVYPETEQPILQTVDYYFCRPDIDLLPGHSSFSLSNTTPLMVTSVGDPYFAVAGYARQRILNGDPAKFGFLGQYFDTAYKANLDGVATTNQTGILSPYGEFFPTESGLTALLTMADTNQGGIQGTCLVHVISLSTDVNRDGVIDTSFAGPDFTSWERPLRFWVNDDNDGGETKGNDIPGYPAVHKGIPNGSDTTVNSVRDLLDFFPVYLDIQSVLGAFPSNALTCWLKHEDGALNYVDPTWYMDTDLGPTNCLAYLTDTNVAREIARVNLPSAPAYPITDIGVPLNSAFLSRIRDQGKGILLIEARTNTSSPLVLEIRQGTNVLAEATLYVSITSVEKMFRQKNLLLAGPPTNAAAFGDRLADVDVPNEPETNEKNFVFVHGYNVNPNQARGTFAETFKRVYWSGSQARFYGVTWFGSDTQGAIYFPGTTTRIPGTSGITPNYHTNVLHAFETAPSLAIFLATLTNGPTTVMAHSLGNMLALSALRDFYAPIDNYFMLNAAVAIEAVDSGATPDDNMVHTEWLPYTNRLYSANWHKLFTDFRGKLNWSGRLTNFNNAQVYNFYSSGEEVLRDWQLDPPTNLLSYSVQVFADYRVSQSPASSYVWVWEEKAKGRAARDDLLGSTHGGWKFNTNYSSLTPAQAALLSTNQLQTNAFFDFGSPGFSGDLRLQGDLGNAYAYENRDRILSDAIPALTWAIGSHPVPRLSPPQRPDEGNFDMQALYENGWPSSRPPRQVGAPAPGEWRHSDFKDVAYTFVYPLFNKFVEKGNLK